MEERRPVRILVECPEYIVSASLGVVNPLKQVEARGGCEVIFKKTIDIYPNDLSWADIVVTVRGCEVLTLKIVEAAKKAGRFVVYYLDDDLLNIPSESLAREYYEDPMIKNNMIKLLQLSNVLWGVNVNIKKRYMQYCPGRWIQNRLPVSQSKSSHLQTKTRHDSGTLLKVLYAGSQDHLVLVRELLADVIKLTVARLQNRVSFTFIGVDPGVRSDDGTVQYIPYIKPYEAYREFVENEEYDIGLAPVRDEAFYSCKYYNKYIEYSSAGIVGLYSNAEPYTQIVVDGQNGILCDNTASEWADKLVEFSENPKALESCRNNMLENLRTQFNVDVVTEDLISQCPEFTNYYAISKTEKEIAYRHSILLFYIFRAEILIRSRGILGIPVVLARSVKVVFKAVFKRVKKFVNKIHK